MVWDPDSTPIVAVHATRSLPSVERALPPTLNSSSPATASRLATQCRLSLRPMARLVKRVSLSSLIATARLTPALRMEEWRQYSPLLDVPTPAPAPPYCPSPASRPLSQKTTSSSGFPRPHLVLA